MTPSDWWIDKSNSYFVSIFIQTVCGRVTGQDCRLYLLDRRFPERSASGLLVLSVGPVEGRELERIVCSTR